MRDTVEQSISTSAMLLRACFRMNPDRILMTEIRRETEKEGDVE